MRIFSSSQKTQLGIKLESGINYNGYFSVILKKKIALIILNSPSAKNDLCVLYSFELNQHRTLNVQIVVSCGSCKVHQCLVQLPGEERVPSPGWRSMDRIQLCSSYTQLLQEQQGSATCLSPSAVPPPPVGPPSWRGLGSTSRPRLQRSAQGSSPPSRSAETACPAPPCRRSARQHTALSDGPPGRGPSTPRWRRTPSGCPAGGAIEQHSHHVRVLDACADAFVCMTCFCQQELSSTQCSSITQTDGLKARQAPFCPLAAAGALPPQEL